MIEVKIHDTKVLFTEAEWNYLEHLLLPFQKSMSSIPVIHENITVGYISSRVLRAVMAELNVERKRGVADPNGYINQTNSCFVTEANR